MNALSPKQQSALDRILRCPGCGAWEIVTRTEAAMRAADIWPFTPPCPHDNRAGHNQEVDAA